MPEISHGIPGIKMLANIVVLSVRSCAEGSSSARHPLPMDSLSIAFDDFKRVRPSLALLPIPAASPQASGREEARRPDTVRPA